MASTKRNPYLPTDSIASSRRNQPTNHTAPKTTPAIGNATAISRDTPRPVALLLCRSETVTSAGPWPTGLGSPQRGHSESLSLSSSSQTLHFGLLTIHASRLLHPPHESPRVARGSVMLLPNATGQSKSRRRPRHSPATAARRASPSFAAGARGGVPTHPVERPLRPAAVRPRVRGARSRAGSIPRPPLVRPLRMQKRRSISPQRRRSFV